MLNSLENALRNAKKADVPDSTFAKVNDTLRNLEHRRDEKHMKTIYKRLAAVAAAATAICLLVLGGLLISPQSGNVFELKAYALEHQEDGSVVYTALQFQDPERQNGDQKGFLAWGGFHDGKNLLMSVNLKVEGENIKHIDFCIDDGFFAKQYLKFDENGKLITDGVSILYVGKSSTIASYGQDYEIIGASFTLNKDDLTDDLLIFVGREDDRWGQGADLLEKPFIVRAVATFNDGKSQEETLVFDFNAIGEEAGGGGLIVRHFSDEEVLQMFYDTTDMGKMEQAFINEAKNQNIGEVRVTNIDIHNFDRQTWAGYWMVTFDLLPEGCAEWLPNQTQAVQQMSTDPVTRDIVVRFYNE